MTLSPTRPEVALYRKYIWQPPKPEVKAVLVCMTGVSKIPTASHLSQVMQFNGVVDDTTGCRVIPEIDMTGNQTYVLR